MLLFVPGLISVLGGCATSEEGLTVAPKATVSVCPTASYTLQDAIDDAADGDTLEVCDGTYSEHLVLAGRRLTLRSLNGAASTVIDGTDNGTAITVSGGADVTIDDLTIEDGGTETDGGNVYCASSTITITSSTLRAGRARHGGGLGASACSVDVSDTTFSGNVSSGTEGGGGVWVSGGSGTVSGNVLSSNTATSLGGGIYVSGGAVAVEGNEVTANWAAYGGGIYGDGDVVLDGNDVTGNTATQRGGGVYLLESNADITANSISSNESFNDGGGLYLDGGSPLVSGNTFTGNDAGDDGGGLRARYSGVTVEDNTFTSNTTATIGGGVKISHWNVTLSNNTFTSNEAGRHGGGLALDDSGSTVSDSTFTSNTAGESGGGLHVLSGTDSPLIEGCTFTSNVAIDRGGHAFIERPYVATDFLHTKLVSGTAAEGGAIYVEDGYLDVTNSLLQQNSGTTAGGGLYYDGSDGSITNVVVWRNTSPSGSGMYAGASSVVAVTNSVFGRNTSSAAVVVAASTVSWRYNDMFANTARFSGMTDPLRRNGNLSVNPGFTNSNAGNYTLTATSGLVNTGDPTIFDVDGSRSDMGMYGPNGSW